MTIDKARENAREHTKPDEDQERSVDLNKPGFIKDLGSVTDPVGEIVDLGSM
jgi:hypothetical protein